MLISNTFIRVREQSFDPPSRLHSWKLYDITIRVHPIAPDDI
jgi:hypothetical protein